MAQNRVSTRRRHRESDVIVLVLLKKGNLNYHHTSLFDCWTPNTFTFWSHLWSLGLVICLWLLLMCMQCDLWYQLRVKKITYSAPLRPVWEAWGPERFSAWRDLVQRLFHPLTLASTLVGTWTKETWEKICDHFVKFCLIHQRRESRASAMGCHM